MAKRRLKTGNIIAFIILLICLISIIFSVYKIIEWKINVDKNNEIQEDLKEHIDINNTVDKKERKYNIDWKSLKEKNSDIVAYLKVNGTNIDYVVVKGNDNSYYLNHNIYKEYNIAGSIFMDYHNKLDGKDRNIVIYGHNTSDGSMFGTLKNTLNKDWYENEENREIVLATEDEEYYYQVFSTYSVKPNNYYINTQFDNDKKFDSFIKDLKVKSIYNYNVEVSKEDKILTLSSCYGNSSRRVVLHAKLIKR